MPRLPRRLLSSLLLLSLCTGGVASAWAQSASADPVTVKRVQFSQTSGRDAWAEFSVTLTGGLNPDPAAANPNFNDLVKVKVSLSYQHGGGGEPVFSFYRSEATLVSLERTKDATVTFYLPPEIVRRDRLPREPFAWLVELEVGGQPLPGRQNHVSRSLNNLDVISSFRSRVTAAGAKTDGLLVPVYLTPFYGPDLAGRSSDLPSFVRREPTP